MAEAGSRRFLFLLDDGWRYEKREVLYFLKERGFTVDIATHDETTREKLSSDFVVHGIPAYSLKKCPAYILRMFFARELETKTVRLWNRLRYQDMSWGMKLLYRLRGLAGLLGLRRRTYGETLATLYRNSNYFGDLLKEYDVVLFSPVSLVDKRILYEAKHRGLSLVCWVFSWDNPMKDNEFLADADTYLVWNEQNAGDLGELFGIERDRIDIVGPAQFDFLLRKRNEPAPPKQDYVMYACSMGLTYYIEQEIRIALRIRAVLDEVAPGIKLLVRPYPFRDGSYGPLEDHAGIEVSHFGHFEGGRALIEKEDLDEKYRQIQQARCFINFASTIALEASFTDTPILQLRYNYPHGFPNCQDLIRVLENDHLRYILDYDVPNMMHDETALKGALERIVAGDTERYRPYSRQLQSFADPLACSSYKELFLEKLEALRAK